MIDIYNNKSQFKYGFVFTALVLGLASLIYSNILVNQLAKREQKTIDLYARAWEFIAKSDINDDISFVLELKEDIDSNMTIPVILKSKKDIIDFRNIKIPKNATEKRKKTILNRELKVMKEQYPPIVIDLGYEKQYVYYRDSDILIQLRYYPYVQIVVVLVFGFLTYQAFSYSRRAEQNRVWVGLAKETAHQLGTPISSLMAWIDFLKLDSGLKDESITMEMEKDIRRLQTVTSRFSSIGSEPALQKEDVYFIVLGITNYLKKRISTKVKVSIKNELPMAKSTQMNRHLFEWVIENIVKNAVDAMEAKGDIMIHLGELPEGDIYIDIKDTGKGMSKSQVKQVFNAGFTTKKRGWGLGLTLAKRIIDSYHKGKLTIKESELGEGTTFRILLKADNSTEE